MESLLIASTLLALRQVQGAEEESVLCGGKEEAGGELFGTEVTAGKQGQHERLPPGHRRGPCGMGQRPPSRLPDCSSESGFLHTCSQSRWYILDSIAVK